MFTLFFAKTDEYLSGEERIVFEREAALANPSTKLTIGWLFLDPIARMLLRESVISLTRV